MNGTYPPPDPWGQGERQSGQPAPFPYGGQGGQPGGSPYPSASSRSPHRGSWGDPDPPPWVLPEWTDHGWHGWHGAYKPTRPGTVFAAVIMTYVGSAVLILLGLLLVFVGATNSAEDFANPEPDTPLSNLPPEALRGVLLGIGAWALVLGIALTILAVLAQKGRGGARIALTVIGGINIVLGLADLVTGSTRGMLSVAWVGAVIILLWVGGANDWYRANKGLP